MICVFIMNLPTELVLRMRMYLIFNVNNIYSAPSLLVPSTLFFSSLTGIHALSCFGKYLHLVSLPMSNSTKNTASQFKCSGVGRGAIQRGTDVQGGFVNT